MPSEPSIVTPAGGQREQRPKVLLVDDEAPIRKLFRELLETMGCVVDAVADGVAAIERFAPTRYDLVVTDFLMPGINGLELAQRLRSADPALPILMVTGSGIDIEAQARALGIFSIAKPVTIDAFSRAVSEALASAKASPSARRAV